MRGHGQTGAAGALRPVAWAAIIVAGLPGCAVLPWDRREPTPEPPKAAAAPAPKTDGGADVRPVPANPQSSHETAKSPVVPASSTESSDATAVSQLPPPRPLPTPAEAVPSILAPTTAPPPLANTLVAPTAGGGLLNLAPHETAIERAVELAQRLGIVEAEKQALAIRVRQLEAALEARDRMLAESAREVEQANAEMATTRNDVRNLRKDLATVSAQMRQSEKADLDSMKAILASLEKLLDPASDKDTGQGNKETRRQGDRQ